MTDFYDSIRQRQYRTLAQTLCDEKLPDTAKSLYTGRLRFDVLLSQTVVLTDAMLLDGTFFLDVEPRELADSLARREGEEMPVEIRARAENLEHALLMFVRYPELPNLRGFIFSGIEDDEQRIEAKKVLEETPASELRSWRDLGRVFRRAGVTAANAEKLEAAWACWIGAQRCGVLKVATWHGDFELDRALPRPETLSRGLRTAEGASLAQRVWDSRGDRSSIDAALSEAKFTAAGDLLKDVAAIESRFHRSYNTTIALQHECDNYESVYDASTAIMSRREFVRLGIDDAKQRQARSPRPTLNLPPGFLLALGTMPSDCFRTLFWEGYRRGHFQKWWETGELEALRRALDPFVNKCAEGSHLPVKWRLASRLVSAGIGCGVGGPVGAVLGVLLEYFTIERIGDVRGARARRLSQRILRIAEERQTDERKH
ncbi:MAG: hypothetical protein Q8Q12_03530 [bacterium]|nr:hypothetical protein [bacterium]